MSILNAVIQHRANERKQAAATEKSIVGAVDRFAKARRQSILDQVDREKADLSRRNIESQILAREPNLVEQAAETAESLGKIRKFDIERKVAEGGTEALTAGELVLFEGGRKPARAEAFATELAKAEESGDFTGVKELFPEKEDDIFFREQFREESRIPLTGSLEQVGRFSFARAAKGKAFADATTQAAARELKTMADLRVLVENKAEFEKAGVEVNALFEVFADDIAKLELF